MPWLSPRQLRRRLVGKRLSFYGDSLTRQLFHRMVWHVRGFPTIVENYYHDSATYAFNATHDALTVVPHSDYATVAHVVQSGVVDPLFTATFYWRGLYESSPSSVTVCP